VQSALNASCTKLTALRTHNEQWTNATSVQTLWSAICVFKHVFKRFKGLETAYGYMDTGRPDMYKEMLRTWIVALKKLRHLMGGYEKMAVCCVEEAERVRSLWRDAGGVGWPADEVVDDEEL
jgi:hypothetical protein